ncbi:hypothetical protein M0638_04775 [Roseomonas sp. NAR14]|uniref:RadC-like JAB domain-containing protein n=1 Tax=Roseomonas acroporae TaxID=2937791 RepID=A0A9X1Y7K2_9PROT|nr:JAB domain-containing protein [Roseomonas acroporae]MCK8783695.1 hypothetical protein [Roseomonas acroporae]
MRARLLADPAALADYELLEMLLFLGIPRRDTKPLAKATINRFGSLAAVLSATPRTLHEATGLRGAGIGAIKLVEAAAARLGAAEARERPLLNRWDRLTAYLDGTPDAGPEAGQRFRMLFLDNRNRLLADEATARPAAADEAAWRREVMRRALELHATALLLIHTGGDRDAAETAVETTMRLREAGRLLAITVHDHLLRESTGWTSLRREGLL